MSFIEDAKKALAELPLAEIQRARVELAVDQAEVLQRQVEGLQQQVSDLRTRLATVQCEHDKIHLELEKLKEEHSEEVVIKARIEMRRGKRTENQWRAFCPKCHLPIGLSSDSNYLHCHSHCGWGPVQRTPEHNGLV
jgi:FtsZ-binding cell division protein ZapB